MVLCFPGHASASVRVNVSIHSEELQTQDEIGSVNVEGLGNVRLLAIPRGKKIIVKALVKGEVIGRAETFVGLTQTPLFLQTPSGLKEILIFWGQSLKNK